MKLFVPGRICLFGEHSDWAGGYRRTNPDLTQGYTLICGTDQGIYADIEPHPTSLVLTATAPGGEQFGPHEFPIEPKVLLAEAQQGGFWSYVAGAAYQVVTHYPVRGLVIDNYKTDLPIKKGVSSSAAICVLVARAFNRLYNLNLTIRDEMELAYQGEIITPSRCGRMDQGCAFGNRPVLMTFDGDRLDTAELRAGGSFHLVIVDLHAYKDTKHILEHLNRCYPFAENEIQRGVHDLLGPNNQRIVHQAVEALQTGDAERLGALMTEAQAAFDRYAIPACPEQLTAPVLHRVLSYEPLQAHIWGGKGVGSQGDGSAQFLARSQADQQAVIEIIERDLGMSCLKLTLQADHRVRKAVVPAAGLGTRLFPATKAVKKELFPIIDRDGIAKPALLLIVEEALQAGIEEVIVIVQPEDLPGFESFFSSQISRENYDRLPSHLQAYADRILEIGHHVTFVTQAVQEGFGHAVYLAREAVGNEPFLLMLGDHLYRSGSEISCARQLLDAYGRAGVSVVGLRRTPEAEVIRFGTVAGQWIERNQLLKIGEFAEKPTPDYARAHLHVDGLPEGEYLTLFGQYVITANLFDYLGQAIEGGRREQGEFQLTSALESLRQEDGCLGLMIDGRCFDIGVPGSYLQTLTEFGQA
jgi:UTP-glucose-1-phosphate uridylyltransferase/mevalonate kinase